MANPPEQIYLIGEIEESKFEKSTQDGPGEKDEGKEQVKVGELEGEDADDTYDGDTKWEKGMDVRDLKLWLLYSCPI